AAVGGSFIHYKKDHIRILITFQAQSVIFDDDGISFPDNDGILFLHPSTVIFNDCTPAEQVQEAGMALQVWRLNGDSRLQMQVKEQHLASELQRRFRALVTGKQSPLVFAAGFI